MSWTNEESGGVGIAAGNWDAGENYSGHDDAATVGDSFEVTAAAKRGADDGGCRNCGEDGHFARDCPQPRMGGGGGGDCFNCGQPGHSKADCTEPRVFKGTCRICEEEGHPASQCPKKPAEVCFNCKKEGHGAIDCKDNRALDNSKVPLVSPEVAWEKLKAANEERDLDDIRDAVKIYAKAIPDMTYDQLENAFRRFKFDIYLIAYEKEVDQDFYTFVNLQGKIDCKYYVGYFFSANPARATQRAIWPSSPEENIERLKDAGIPEQRGVPKCNNCSQMGHMARDCKEEKMEINRVVVNCVNCEGVGHRARDCPQPRKDRFACRNCKQSGHAAADCTEPRSAEGVECKRCNEVGHFAKDCPNQQAMTCRNCGQEGHMSKECDQPRNPDNVTCRNCDKTGHFSRDCPEPKDWSKVKCSNCGEMGHTIKRCKQPVADAGSEGVGLGIFGGFGGSENIPPPASAPKDIGAPGIEAEGPWATAAPVADGW